MKMKRILSIIILMLALPATCLAAHVYYDPNTGDYYTVSYDAYGNTIITNFDTQVSYDEGYYNDEPYYGNPYYYSSPHYYNYTPYPFFPLLYFSGSFGGGHGEHHHGEYGGFHGGHGGFGGGHGHH